MVRRLALVFATAVAAAGSVFAAKARDDPLDRRTPVPADQPIPIIDFFRPLFLIAPELNPAGTHFAALISTGADRRDLAIFELATNRAERLRGEDNQDIGRFEWLNDDRLLFQVTADKLYTLGLFVAERGRLRESFPLSLQVTAVPIGFPRADPQQVIVWIKYASGARLEDGGVIRIDAGQRRDPRASLPRRRAEAGIMADIIRRYPTINDEDPVGYLAGLDGELAFGFTVRDGRRTLWHLRDQGWLRCPVDLDQISILAPGTGRDELLVLAPAGEGRPRAVRPLRAATGELGDVLLQDDHYDVVDVRCLRHPVDQRLLGFQYVRKGLESVWIDATYEALQTKLQALFPQQVVLILGTDRAERHFFVQTFSDLNPTTYHHVDLEAGASNLLTRVAPWIDPARMQPMRLLSYKARDGRLIEGYLTLPAGTTKETPAPLVVLPHGGPWVRDRWGWDAEVQFLASRGYAVFQPNYRGSDGTAWRFPVEDLWSFRKMHDDVTDGTRAVLRTGLIDPGRMAIMGTSFGAYLALCGAAYEPDLYRCAITIAGVFDWERVMRESRGNELQRGWYGELRRRLGDPKKERDAFEAISPLRAVDQIKVPVFVAHGREDSVADVAQSRRLISELKKHRVPHETQIENTEGHGFRHLDNRVELYGRVEQFLAHQLTPQSR